MILLCFPLQGNLFMSSSGIVDRLHDLRGLDVDVNAGRKRLAAGNIVNESRDLVEEHVGVDIRRFGLGKSAVLGPVNGEAAAVLQTDAGFGAHKVDIGLGRSDVFSPGSVDGDDRSFGTDQARYGILDIIGAVLNVFGHLRPHAGVNIVLHIRAQLAEGLAADGDRFGVSGAVHNDIQIMNAPVDQRAASCDGLGGEGAAQSGDGAVSAEAYINMIDLTQLALVDVLFDAVDTVVETVNDTDVEDAAGLMLNLLHDLSFLIGTGGRFLAQDILAGPHSVAGDLAVHIVGSADGNGLDFRIIQSNMVVGDRCAAAVVFNGLFGSFRNDIAEILDFHLILDLHVRGDMSGVCDGTASDDSNFDLAHFFKIPF